ncbi:MAG: sigma-54-dependent Fis family transcriptional regulator, partial [Bdellovibrionales bacterium]|nr:sigma-54-dependent Fis family transcriptional regulator [Bdellovibrionales bacterium]
TQSGRKMASSNEIEVTDDGVDLDKIMGQIEKELIIKAIHQANGVKKKAAKLLKITFRSMRYRIEKYNLGTVNEDELADD